MFARIIENKVWETVSFDPSGLYPDDFLWVECPEDTRQGAVYDENKKSFKNPPDQEIIPPTPEGPVYRTLMTPIRFKAQFNVPERLAINSARAYSPIDPTKPDTNKSQAKNVLDILFGDLDDPRLLEVDVSDSSVISGIDFVQMIGILTPDRAAKIKLGILVKP